METFEDVRDWVLRHRERGEVGATYETVGPNLGNVGFKIYEPKLPGDELQFIMDCWNWETFSSAKLKFEEHPDIRSFWVFPLVKKGEPSYERIHEEFKLSEPLENLKKVFDDGRYDYLVDSLMADDGK